jgi:hypothetical protein
MMSAIAVIGGVVILEARPVYMYLQSHAYGGSMSPMEMIIGFGLAAVLCGAATLVPISIAERRMETFER